MREPDGCWVPIEMNDKLQINPFKRRLYRVTAILLASLSIIAGLVLASMERRIWPLLATGYLLFISHSLWVASSWSLEIGPEGIALERRGKRFFLPWTELSECAPGHGIDRHKVELAFQGEPSLTAAYRGMAKLKLRHPRFLPDTFGMSAKDLADLLNAKKRESTSD